MIPNRTAADQRLATYGTLAPGRPNAHQLSSLSGRWSDGVVRGRLIDAGWGATMGYPAIILDESGQEVPVQVFTSSDLPKHWSRLDAFEGDAYRREVTAVRTAQGTIWASIYTLAPR